MGFKNVKFAPTGVPTIGEMMGMASQAVGDGVCSTCLVIYPTGQLGRPLPAGGENADDYARGARQLDRAPGATTVATTSSTSSPTTSTA